MSAPITTKRYRLCHPRGEFMVYTSTHDSSMFYGTMLYCDKSFDQDGELVITLRDHVERAATEAQLLDRLSGWVLDNLGKRGELRGPETVF